MTDIIGRQVVTKWRFTGVHWHRVTLKQGLKGVVTGIDKANCVIIRVTDEPFVGLEFAPGKPGELDGGAAWGLVKEKAAPVCK